MSGFISIERVLSKLDSYFASNDYSGAERHLKYWLDEAVAIDDTKSELTLCNELVGLSRKIGNKEQTFFYTERALGILKRLEIEGSIGAATTYINVATAYKAFGEAESSLSLFEKAAHIYESELPENDSRLGGLYNNFALALIDVGDFKKAYKYYQKALDVMKNVEGGELESAITYLNLASAYELEKGLLDADEDISNSLQIAAGLLDTHKDSVDGYYAFVCEKCASVFGYYGHFAYEKELLERAKKIYERA